MADSNITKKALADAFRELMETENFSKISVADICEKCDMNRKSFYYHFKDKYDLMNWIFDTQFIAVIKKQGFSLSWESILALSRYFYENRSFYRKALSIQGQNSFTEHFRELISPVVAAWIQELAGDTGNGENNDFQINFFSDAVVLAFQRWLLEKNCLPPEEFVRQLKQCVRFLAAEYQDMDFV